MSKVTVKLNLKGINEVMKSDGVQSDLARRAKKMADAAGEGFESVVNPARYTARAFVRTTDAASMIRQAQESVLESSLDALR